MNLLYMMNKCVGQWRLVMNRRVQLLVNLLQSEHVEYFEFNLILIYGAFAFVLKCISLAANVSENYWRSQRLLA